MKRLATILFLAAISLRAVAQTSVSLYVSPGSYQPSPRLNSSNVTTRDNFYSPNGSITFTTSTANANVGMVASGGTTTATLDALTTATVFGSTRIGITKAAPNLATWTFDSTGLVTSATLPSTPDLQRVTAVGATTTDSISIGPFLNIKGGDAIGDPTITATFQPSVGLPATTLLLKYDNALGALVSLQALFEGAARVLTPPRVYGLDGITVTRDDTAGSVTLRGQGVAATPNLQQVTDVGHVTTQPITVNNDFTVSGFTDVQAMEVHGASLFDGVAQFDAGIKTTSISPSTGGSINYSGTSFFNGPVFGASIIDAGTNLTAGVLIGSSGPIYAQGNIETTASLSVGVDATVDGFLSVGAGAGISGSLTVFGGLDNVDAALFEGATTFNSTITDGANGFNFNSVGTDSPNFTVGSSIGGNATISGDGTIVTTTYAASADIAGTMTYNGNAGEQGFSLDQPLTIGTGSTAIANFYKVTSTQSLGLIASLATTTFDVTVTGATAGSTVIANPPTNFDNGLIVAQCLVNASNTVRVKVNNITALGITPSSGSWTISVLTTP